MFLYSLLLLMTLSDVISAVVVPWVPAVAGVHDSAVVLTAVDVPGVPAVAAVPTAINVPSATGMVFPTFLASLFLLAHCSCWLPCCFYRKISAVFCR